MKLPFVHPTSREFPWDDFPRVTIKPQKHPLHGSMCYRAEPWSYCSPSLPPQPASSNNDNLQNLYMGLGLNRELSSVIGQLPSPSSPHSFIFAWSPLFLIDRELEISFNASYILRLGYNCQLLMSSFAQAPTKPLRVLPAIQNDLAYALSK